MPRRSIVAALLLAAAPFTAAQAQERDLDREPSVGKIYNGSVPEGGGTSSYLLTLQAGQAIELTAAPVAGSDPVVRVYDAGTGELIAENDDSAGSLASNVRLYSEQRRRVRIEVGNASVEDSNAAMRFDLVLRPSDYRPSPPRQIALGESQDGTLAASDEQLFHFEGERGQLWEFALSAAPGSSLDPALQVFAGTTAGGEELAGDDDGGGGLNSRVRFIVPDNGTYTVRAYAIGSSEGGYVLTAGRVEPTVAQLRDVGIGTAATATLEPGEGEHIYRFSEAARARLAAGTGPLVVTMNRAGGDGSLDPILDIGFETPLGFSSLLSDDDGGGETNARLIFDGTGLTGEWIEALRIKARSYDNSSGPYELLVADGTE